MRMAIFMVLLSCIVNIYAFGGDMILEKKDIINFQINTKISHDKVTTLTVSGLAFQSSMVVQKIELIADGPKSVTVFVHLSLTKPGLSGRFMYTTNIPEGIDIVKFGMEETVIWNKNNLI